MRTEDTIAGLVLIACIALIYGAERLANWFENRRIPPHVTKRPKS